MPDLNLIDEGGIEESTTPSAPAPAKRGGGGGGSLNKILMAILVLLIVGTALFYAYKKGKFPFKKKAPVTVVQEEPFQEPEAQQQPQQQQPMATNQVATQPIDTASVPLLETPPVVDATKKPDSKLVKTSGAPVKGSIAPASTQKITDMQGNFTVQVSAYRDKKQADIIAGRLTDAGYPAYVATIPMKGVDWYTVRIGHYPTRDDAKKAVADFALELRSNYYIQRVKN